jgi:hypothetical protein
MNNTNKALCLAGLLAAATACSGGETNNGTSSNNTVTSNNASNGQTVNNVAANNTTPNTTANNVANNTSADMGTGNDTGTQQMGPLQDWCGGQPAEFSFFVTSMDALWALSDSTPGDLDGGFGGDFGGLAGADDICQTIATATGHGDKTWRAFLSATDDGNGNPVNAIERIGGGPWTDANGRLVATGLDGLLGAARPDGDPQSTADLPDECGVPLSVLGDSHDVPTGSNLAGMLNDTDPESTCNDWTSSDGAVGSTGGTGPGDITGTVMCGHAFPRAGNRGGQQWLSDHPARGCGKGANLIQNRAGEGTCIGCAGGYGAIYCFAL